MRAIAASGYGAKSKMSLLVQVPVKTANYTANPNEVVACDTTSGPFTVQLPNAPQNGTLCAVKLVVLGTGHAVTVATQGSDVFNRSGGGTTLTEQLVYQGVLLQYDSGIWIVLADDLPLAQLDSRYFGPPPSGDTSGATDGAALLALLGQPAAVLQAGTYWVPGPLLGTVAGGLLRGVKGATPSVYDGDPPVGGTIIKAASGWSAGAVSTPALIQAQADGFHLRDIWIDGTNLPSNIDGFNDGSGRHAIGVRNVGVWAATQRGFAQAGSAWHMHDVLAACTGGTGFYGNWTDSVVENGHGQGCGQSGTGSALYISGSECKFTNFRADLSQDGILIDAATFTTFLDVIQLVGCSSQRNNHRGVKITNSSASGQASRAPVLITNFVSDADGVNGTLNTTGGGSISGGAGGSGYAGIHVEGANTVTIVGYHQTMATRDVAGGCPDYGISTAAIGTGPGVPTLVTLDDALLNGKVGPINDAAPAALFAKGSKVFQYTGAVYQGTSTAPTQVAPTPWSALGDLLYGGASGVPAKLAGNTATQQEFLGQAGNGSVSAAPAWAVVPGQILAIGQYAPGTQQTKTLGTSGITVFAAFDTTNLTTPAFTVPASGKVKVTVSLNIQTNTTSGKIFLNLGAHSSVTPLANRWECTDNVAGVARMYTAEFYITGLTPGASQQFDLLGAGTTGTIITILAFGDTGGTPSTSGGSPVIFTIQAAP